MTQTPRQIHFHLIPLRWGEYKAALCWCAAAAVSAQLDDVSFLSLVWAILFCCTMSCQLNRLLLTHLSRGSFPKWQEEKSDKALPLRCSGGVGLGSAPWRRAYYQVFVGWMYPEGWSVSLHIRRGSGKHLNKPGVLCQTWAFSLVWNRRQWWCSSGCSGYLLPKMMIFF